MCVGSCLLTSLVHPLVSAFNVLVMFISSPFPAATTPRFVLNCAPPTLFSAINSCRLLRPQKMQQGHARADLFLDETCGREGVKRKRREGGERYLFQETLFLFGRWSHYYREGSEGRLVVRKIVRRRCGRMLRSKGCRFFVLLLAL